MDERECSFGCEHPDRLVFCTGCNEYYCEPCWPRRSSHKNKAKLGPGGVPHEKVDPDVVDRVEGCMAEPEDESDERQQHDDDQESTWFGLERDHEGEPVLTEYHRYAALMMEAASATETAVRHPGLVSFMGDTGAGKSTLIRLLMGPSRAKDGDRDLGQWTAPIIGRSGSEVPTSADVHLYADPKTFASERPLLFADCEGFRGGERDPVASGGGGNSNGNGGAIKRRAVGSTSPPGSKPRRMLTSIGASIQRRIPGSASTGRRHSLSWARRDAPNHEETSKRQYAVTKMYPRIFYAFSDVIVFVMNNPNTMEGVIEQMLEWADANYSGSINVPTKPHAIIALNKCLNSTPDHRWSHFASTEELFRTMNAQIHKNPTFQLYVKKWQEKNMRISDMDELFRCYYSSVHVIRLPDKSRYQLLDQQRSELYAIIEQCCASSYKKKRDTRMLPDVDEFGLYLSLAFDHFSHTLNEPFDYVQASMKYQPPPVSMADNLRVFVRLVGRHLGTPGEVENLFTRITGVVASSLLLESLRKRHFGQPEDWFKADLPVNSEPRQPHNKNVGTRSSYESMCTSVLNEYFKHEVQCIFEIKPSRRSLRSAYRCEQFWNSHGEMHRQKSGDAIWGEFKHPFRDRSATFSWASRVFTQIKKLYGTGAWNDSPGARGARAREHAKTLRPFYQALLADEAKAVATTAGGSNNANTRKGLFCNSICLCCLFNPPDYTLACGHAICLDCIKDFGHLVPGPRVVVDECPLHARDGFWGMGDGAGTKATIIDLDPAHAGLRVLTLDGGGIRGIAELTMLKALEARLGVPVRHFFDLVVGTSTGGIVALALGHELWSIDECITKFKELVTEAFTLRGGQKIFGIQALELFIKKSKYETKPLEKALSSSFGRESLFGVQQSSQHHRRLRVAVTAVSSAGQNPWVISNYSARKTAASDPSLVQHGPEDDYQRLRPERPDEELEVWEAARSTSAAPGLFKPFSKSHDPAFIELMDGALRHNNPIQIAVEESHRLATAHDLSPVPDLVLSLGTGLSREQAGTSNFDNYKDGSHNVNNHHHHRHQSGQQGDALSGLGGGITSNRYAKVPLYRTAFALVKVQIQLNLDTEARWRTWSAPLVQAGPSSPWHNRFFRLNPDLGEEPPKLDEVAKVQPLANAVAGWAGEGVVVPDKITEIACALVASSFYFEREGKAVRGGDGGGGESDSESTSSATRGSGQKKNVIKLHGFIRCRIRQTESEALMGLGRFLASCQYPARFVISHSRDGGGGFGAPHHDFREQHIDVPITDLRLHGRWDDLPVTLEIAGEDVMTRVVLEMYGMYKSPVEGRRVAFDISGFPRQLMRHDYRWTQI